MPQTDRDMTDEEREAALNSATQGSADDWSAWDEDSGDE